jgi:hypothetical protein
MAVLATGLFVTESCRASPDQQLPGAAPEALWKHDNLVAWCVVPFDAKKRGPEERARLLEGLGFKHFAYDWRDKDIPTFDVEIETLKKHGIDLFAWWFPFDADNPLAKHTLEVFKRHNSHPQLWVALIPPGTPKGSGEWSKLFPNGFPIPKTEADLGKLSPSDKTEFYDVIAQLSAKHLGRTPEEQEQQVKQDADRIRALVNLAAPYGCRVELYNHNGWFGIVENQLAVIDRLKELGVTDVGLVYNFSHARDELHDDSRNFPELWGKMKGHVVAVNITGMRWDGHEVYPSQGDSELDMMRTIQDSGWRGPIGLIAEKGGDAEITLRSYLMGLDWLADELKHPGARDPRPFPPAP